MNVPKSKASSVVQIGQRNLVDAKAMGALIGFTAQYVNRLAAAGKITWHGVDQTQRSGFRYIDDYLERETGIEPATFSLGS